MLAKLSSKSQITIPPAIMEQFPGNEYIMDVTVEDGRIVLTPVRATRADEVRADIERLGVADDDVAAAVKQVRQDSQNSKSEKFISTFTVRKDVGADGVVTVRGLPLKEGERIEVDIKRPLRAPKSSERYPLRGLPYKYDHPFEPAVPADEWDACRGSLC